MRGTQRYGSTYEQAAGIIPAHAGNTAAPVLVEDVAGDHPRACGEHAAVPLPGFHQIGSSPRMRGTLDCLSVNQIAAGIIPAHAGNTRRHRRGREGVRDHPRACGEHYADVLTMEKTQGSSPRMRGTLRRGERGPDVHGIIPAHAGNTGFRVRADAECGDHPRACGEHPAGAPRMGRTGGSSPRMRGTLHRADSRPRDQGIIPAHAGNTEVRNFFKYLYRDHPRACGEHEDRGSRTADRQGSSPRMRGTLEGACEHVHVEGIIPAHAGNTLRD